MTTGTTSVMPFYRISGTLASTLYRCKQCDYEVVVDRLRVPWTDRFLTLADHLAEHGIGPLVKVVA